MTTATRTTTDLKQAAQKARHEMEEQVTKAVMKQHAEMAAALTKQQKELQGLQSEVSTLTAALRKSRSSGGGFPWGLVLLAGGGYALYRTNPTVRQQIDGLLRRVNPGPEGNLTRAGDAVKSAASDVMQGQSPTTSLRAAGGEAQRAGEKIVGEVKDDLQGKS
ncbi:hypothetical protein DAETH_11590 [Deinococcus aetherius]|uniref:YtxH domain-containing protein n=1 Tax=Deinococcus aetherius TaxID=200252 RepID=A0ABM8ABP5_9DEIO|nr:hypothetical protein [Deinococcus aetherius]BDP41190.1 hypothetical protein DAETH_11590 [Deinococcus aetherius]